MADRRKKWISVREAAARLGVHPETVRRWIRDGQIKARRFGGVWRVDRQEVEEDE